MSYAEIRKERYVLAAFSSLEVQACEVAKAATTGMFLRSFTNYCTRLGQISG